MRKLLLALLLLTGSLLHAQVDRYPYIQQPTETSVLIAWVTQDADIGTLSWGTTPGTLTNTQVDATAVIDHYFTVSGLQANTQYYYQVTNTSGFASAVEDFWTAKTESQDELSFLHYGDCGYDNSVQNGLAALMEQENVDFAVVAGDVDQGIGNNYDGVFFKPYKNMLAKECHYTALGNHDIIANNGDDFYSAFYQPTNNPQNSEHYYTFTWGNAKFICIDSNMDYSPGSDQHNFILDEMKCNDHQWLFLFCHHPPWTNAWDPLYYVPLQEWYEYDGEDEMRTELVPYFEQYNLDFMLTGHSHCYQRGSMNGVEYVISGGAGSPITDSKTCNSFPSYNACAPNLQYELYINEYVRFHINGDTATYICVDPSGTVVDSVSIIKPWTHYGNSFSINNASGAGSADGSVTANTVGPHPPYTYSWANGGSSATNSGLNPGTYYVTITDDFGCAHMDTVVVGLSVSMTEDSPGFSVSVVPNPLVDRTVISFPNPSRKVFTLELFDISGKIVRKMVGLNSESVELNKGNLKTGIYFYRLSNVKGSFSGKLMVQ